MLGKLHSQFPYGKPLREILDEIINDRLEEAKSSPLVEKFDVNVNLIDDVKQVMENFKNQYITKTGQKAKEPHEKSD